ncbi:MAG: hypothetical protein M3N13_07020, partial [Candidatus Eremiobacteraeota bacterium]|nr:hypothetical protein [Candidatus Eremiobacteraeota bacterium]
LLCSQLGRRRALAAFGSALAAFAISCILWAGPLGALHYVEGLRAHAAAERFVLIQITPAAIAYGLGLPTVIASAIGIASALGAFTVALAAWRNQLFRPLWKLAITCALLPFAIPFFHEHDFVVLLLPALLCLTLEDRGTWSLAASGMMLASVDWLGLAQRPGAFSQVALLAIAQLCAIFAVADVPLRRMVLPACVLPVVAGACLLAARFPAPVWPDAMRGAVTLTLPVASVWHEELVRTGQFAVQPAWALLRLLTLAGCALLAWAAFGAAAARDQMERL